MLFGTITEKTAKVLKEKQSKESQQEEKCRGHGKNGAVSYSGAEKIKIPHESLKPKDRCPACKKGKVYDTAKPSLIVRVTGQAPLSAKVYELQKLRCNLCGQIFTAKAPESLGDEKYDSASGAMIALLKYGSGLPFNRLDNLQESLGSRFQHQHNGRLCNQLQIRYNASTESLLKKLPRVMLYIMMIR